MAGQPAVWRIVLREFVNSSFFELVPYSVKAAKRKSGSDFILYVYKYPQSTYHLQVLDKYTGLK